MTKEAAVGRQRIANAGMSSGKSQGFTNITELTYASGMGDFSNESSFGIQTVNGYLFNPTFSLGLGLGIDKYKHSTFIPVFVDARVNFLKGPVTPFFQGDIGYSFISSSGDVNGGLLVNPAVGVKFSVTPQAALNFSIGYRLQKQSVDYSIPNYSYDRYGYPVVSGYTNRTDTFSADFVTIKAGVTF